MNQQVESMIAAVLAANDETLLAVRSSHDRREIPSGPGTIILVTCQGEHRAGGYWLAEVMVEVRTQVDEESGADRHATVVREAVGALRSMPATDGSNGVRLLSGGHVLATESDVDEEEREWVSRVTLRFGVAVDMAAS